MNITLYFHLFLVSQEWTETPLPKLYCGNFDVIFHAYKWWKNRVERSDIVAEMPEWH